MPLFLALLRSETAASPERRAAALAGLRAYQEAPRPAPRPPRPAIAQTGRATLRDYGGSGMPVVFVPSLINPPLVLDLAEDNSLLGWLAEQGVRPLLVDWGVPTPEDRAQDVTTHVEQLLLPLLATLDRPPVLAGYCLGGTIATAAAAAIDTAGLVTIAAPWRFAGYGDALEPISALWDEAHLTCERLGLVPMEVLQAGFWQLDPKRTVTKFERFARLGPDSAESRAFVRLEDWANGGAPLPFAAGRQLFDEFFVADLPGSGRWKVGGRTVDPEALDVPALSFVSTTDRIVPAASAARIGTVRELAMGHVGMIVGGRARGALWQPLVDWLSALGPTR
ncbi:alpha/beta fold hydrolase [Sphingomonas psychrotolerans]|uniref:Alpha/beta hydrolase n=1 Tax=Sphingomonas psychrotolerans TaxID=1327635 RepID=A0A2K8ML44_9SPHN|nr:alpha/beta fold hydrolase [Sphingomonas psychrotolerans]ATY34565.1 alpha/beta hydrolase [Sphingomonas psychrotolerans]